MDLSPSQWKLPEIVSKWELCGILNQKALPPHSIRTGNTSRPAARGLHDDCNGRGSNAIPLNTWTHFVATYDGIALRLFTQTARRMPKSHIRVEFFREQ